MLAHLLALVILVALGYYSYQDKRVFRSANNVLLYLILAVLVGILLIGIANGMINLADMSLDIKSKAQPAHANVAAHPAAVHPAAVHPVATHPAAVHSVAAHPATKK